MAGILAAAVIVLSQSLYLTKEKTEKVKTEQKTDKEGKAFIAAPADAVSQTNTIQLDKQVPALDQKVTVEETHQRKLIVRPEVVVRYFKVLFRAIISPNAP